MRREASCYTERAKSAVEMKVWRECFRELPRKRKLDTGPDAYY